MSSIAKAYLFFFSISLCFASSHKTRWRRLWPCLQNGNWTDSLGPLADDFLPPRNRYLPLDPTEAIAKGQYQQVPIMTGLTCNEGTVVLGQFFPGFPRFFFYAPILPWQGPKCRRLQISDKWRDALGQSDDDVRYFMENTAIANILARYGLNSTELRHLVTWNYIDKVDRGQKLILQLLKVIEKLCRHLFTLIF